jgi:hypothetical protein
MGKQAQMIPMLASTIVHMDDAISTRLVLDLTRYQKFKIEEEKSTGQVTYKLCRGF